MAPSCHPCGSGRASHSNRAVTLEGPDGSLSGMDVMLHESGSFGSHLTRYVVYEARFILLQPGSVGAT